MLYLLLFKHVKNSRKIKIFPKDWKNNSVYTCLKSNKYSIIVLYIDASVSLDKNQGTEVYENSLKMEKIVSKNAYI